MKEQRHNVTIFTDASFCHDTKAAGGAFWARDNVHKTQGSFRIGIASQAHEAELLASCRAIVECIKHEQIGEQLRTGKARLILVIDCLFVTQALEWREVRKPRMSEELWPKLVRVKDLIKRSGFELKINHVKAHSGTRKPRTWVNNWCDKQAKLEMGKLRQERWLNKQGRNL
jgi:ribonuclease HI